MISFKKIDKSNYMKCIELEIHESQKNFVAPNTFSLVQCAYEPDFYPVGIYEDQVMVGFIMYDFDNELKSWSMSRFMIDKNHQGLGIGKRALAQFINFFHSNNGPVPLYTSVDVGNTVAEKLYEQAGFIKRDVFEYQVGTIKHHERRMVLYP